MLRLRHANARVLNSDSGVGSSGMILMTKFGCLLRLRLHSVGTSLDAEYGVGRFPVSAVGGLSCLIVFANSALTMRSVEVSFHLIAVSTTGCQGDKGCLFTAHFLYTSISLSASPLPSFLLSAQ